METDLLPEAGKESTGVIPKAVSLSNKGSIGFLFRDPVHTEKSFRGRDIPEHAQFKSYIKECAHFDRSYFNLGR
jgi:hypothetical protein